MFTFTAALTTVAARLAHRGPDFEPAPPEPATAAPDQPTLEIDCPPRLEDRAYPPIGPSSAARP